MSTSSQEPRGSGLSSSLVSDFRAIMNSLEQQKAARQPEEPVGAAAVPAAAVSAPSIAARTAATPLAERVAPSRPVPARPAAEAPRSFNDVRERLTALGDVSDMLARRAPAAGESAARTSKPEAAGAAAGASEPRRRGFGASPRQPGEAEQRRKRGAPKDVITWQRLGALAVFVALVGGGGVALQSLAAREEAKVAPEVIGNAAVASVAPSAPEQAAPAPVALAAVPAASTTPEPEAAAPESPTRASIAESLPPVLRDTTPPFDVAATPPGVTAFASPADAAATEVEPAVAEAVAAAAAVELPKDVPLPPRAPARRVAAAPAAAAPAAEAPEAGVEDVSDEADSPAGFGGDPVGSATIRRSVTMRAAPKKGATPIGNLSAGEKVQLVACRGWCEVIAEGKRGFIYKSFVDAGTSARADTAADSETTAQ